MKAGVKGIPMPINWEDAGFARCGASQGGGAGEGQVQNSGMGEEVDSPIQTPGVFNNPF